MKVFVSILFALMIHLPDSAAADAHGSMDNVGRLAAKYLRDPASSSNATASFTLWLSCYQKQTPECLSCHQDILSTSVDPVSSDVAKSCIPFPQERSYVFSTQLDPYSMVERDNRICECLKSGHGSKIEQDAFGDGNATPDQINGIRTESARAFDRIYGQEIDQRYSTERMQSTFSAMSYIDVTDDAMKLATTYGVVGTATAAGANTINFGQALVSMRQNQYAKMTNDREITPKKFNTDPMPSGYCLPYRHFISHKQFPVTPAFYDGLSSMSSGYQDQDWNYRSLMAEFQRTIGTRDLEEQLLNNPRAAQLKERAQFLHNNPVLKNIFMSNDQTTKDKLFQLISKMPKPQCPDKEECQRNEEWVAGMEKYRKDMAGFLATGEAILAARSGSEASGRFGLEISSAEARKQSQASQSVIGDTDRIGDATMWVGFCATIDQNNQSNNGMDFASRVEGKFGTRNFDNIEEDGEFERLNGELCFSKRKNPSNNRIESFDDFFKRECPSQASARCSIESRGSLIGEFLNAYNVSVEPGVDENTIALMRPFLGGRISGPERITKTDVANFNRDNHDPIRSREPVRFTSSEYSSLTPASQPGTSRTASAPTRAPASSSSAANTPSVADGAQSAFFAQNGSVTSPTQPVSNAITPQTPEALRSSLAENNLQSQELKNQLAELKRDIDNPVAAKDRTSEALRSLESRLALLQNSLDLKDKERQDLERQLAAAQSEIARTPQPATPQVSSNDSRRPALSSQANVTAGAQAQGGVSGGVSVPSSSSPGGPASLGRSTSGSGAISPRSSGINSALLSSSSGQGAITVGESSTNKIIEIPPLSPSEFDQIAANNQEVLRLYADQISKAEDGRMVLSFTDSSNRVMELFVEKKGNDISIVPGQGAGRAIASESAPEVIDESSRATLKGLRSEMGIENP